MEIRIINNTTYGVPVPGTITSVEGFVETSLDGTGIDRYGIEATERTADNCVYALSRLCDILAEKGILSLQDVTYIAVGNRDYPKLKAIE